MKVIQINKNFKNANDLTFNISVLVKNELY